MLTLADLTKRLPPDSWKLYAWMQSQPDPVTLAQATKAMRFSYNKTAELMKKLRQYELVCYAGKKPSKDPRAAAYLWAVNTEKCTLLLELSKPTDDSV